MEFPWSISARPAARHLQRVLEDRSSRLIKDRPATTSALPNNSRSRVSWKRANTSRRARTASKAKHLQLPAKSLPDVSRRQYARASAGLLTSRAPRRRPPTPGASNALTRGTAPWHSLSVLQLANQLGKNKDVQPMMIEGRMGVVLGAIGSTRDHEVASNVFKEKLSQRAKNPHTETSSPSTTSSHLSLKDKTKALAPIASISGSPSSQLTLPQPQPMSFGAVYEYRDVHGVPKLIGSTEVCPERQYAVDSEFHAPVRKLLANKGGTGSVVWAGCGVHPLTATDMRDMRKAVMHDRSERLNIAKLRSVKPYSRHGFGEIDDKF